MTVERARLGSNYWRLWSASVGTNLGDGLALIAFPWLASLITRDGFKLGLIGLAARLPWLVVSLPAGVLTDRLDRRRTIVVMDLARMAVMVLVTLLVIGFADQLTSLERSATAENMLLGALLVAVFLLGCAEVLRDNAAQTILPAVVEPGELERANGRLWGAEMVMNSFVGPPLAGVMIGLGLSLPFLTHALVLAGAAVLMMSLSGSFRPDRGDRPSVGFRSDLKEGVAWLWSHDLLRPLAIILGVINGLSTAAFATFVFFAQEILQLEAASFGLLMTAGAVGGLVGSLTASRVAAAIGKGPSLFLTLLGSAAVLVTTGVTSSAIVVWVLLLTSTFLAMLWNVITVSLRQRIIPDRILGRVNSVYRFFGWGMMSVGALLGGAAVSLAEPWVGREWALRLPFLAAGGLYLVTWVYSLGRLNSARIAAAEGSVGGGGA